CFVFFFQAEDGIRDFHVTGVQTCALPILTELCDWLLDDSDELLEELDDSDELLLEELDEPLLTSVVVPLVQLTLAVQPGQAFGPWAASTFSAMAICCSRDA